MKKTFAKIGLWIAAFTWGILTTVLGLVMFLILLPVVFFTRKSGAKVTLYKGFPMIHVGKSWGGVSLGPFLVVNINPSTRTPQHELGHFLQTALIGPFQLFLVDIPSAIRYWVRNFKTQTTKYRFAFITISIIEIILGIPLALGILFSIVWLIIPVAIAMGYFVGILLWLTLFEIPLYKDDAYVAYDSIWFEGMATSWGSKL